MDCKSLMIFILLSIKIISPILTYFYYIIDIEAIQFANTAIKVNSYFYNLYTYQ